MTTESLEALWSVTFQSNVAPAPGQPGMSGGGVCVIETGRVFGGDAHFVYVGTGRVHHDVMEIDLLVRKYRPQTGMSVFGPIERFHLRLRGKPDPNRMIVAGPMVEHPEYILTAELIRQEELP